MFEHQSPLAPGASPAVQDVFPSVNRVLVVEDDHLIREVVAAAVAHLGFEVHTAEHGAAGWQALNTRRYQLLITDNNMPRLTGLELVRLVRSARMSLPIIMASGSGCLGEAALGITAYLAKPFFTDQLLQIVREVLAVPERKPLAGLELLPGLVNRRCVSQN